MLYTIGEFSKITALSIKSLRLYHDKELLVPASVDEFTGYRYYDDRNFDTARTIKVLKDFDFSLAEINEILQDCSEEADMMTYLEAKLQEIQDRIKHYETVSRSIHMIVEIEKESTMSDNSEFVVEEKNVETLLIAGYRMTGRYDEVGKGFALLGKRMGRHICGKPMNLYYDGEYKEGDAEFEPCFPVRKGTGDNEISVRELQGGKCVSLIHKGPYDTLGQSYKKLFDYIKEKEYEIALPHREIYIKGPGMIFKGNPKNYLTELIVMID